MTTKSMTDFHYNSIFHDQQNAVKKRDLMFSGLYLDQLKNDGFTLPLKNLYQKYPQVEVYTSNLETAQSLIDCNIENMLIYLLDLANLKMDENTKFAFFYIPEENTQSNAFNTTRKIGSTIIYSTFLFANWRQDLMPETYLFNTLVNEIVCDWWGSDSPEIVNSGEYQQYTAAFTHLIGVLLRIYIKRYPEKPITNCASNDFMEIFKILDSRIFNGQIKHQKISETLNGNDIYSYAKHKKLYKIDNQEYRQIRLERLCEELQNMKNKFGFTSFDYVISADNKIVVEFKEVI